MLTQFTVARLCPCVDQDSITDVFLAAWIRRVVPPGVSLERMKFGRWGNLRRSVAFLWICKYFVFLRRIVSCWKFGRAVFSRVKSLSMPFANAAYLIWAVVRNWLTRRLITEDRALGIISLPFIDLAGRSEFLEQHLRSRRYRGILDAKLERFFADAVCVISVPLKKIVHNQMIRAQRILLLDVVRRQ